MLRSKSVEPAEYQLKVMRPDESKDVIVHPLYQEYFKILEDELPSFEAITNEAEALELMESHLGLISNDYMTKIKGYDK